MFGFGFVAVWFGLLLNTCIVLYLLIFAGVFGVFVDLVVC